MNSKMTYLVILGPNVTYIFISNVHERFCKEDYILSHKICSFKLKKLEVISVIPSDHDALENEINQKQK